MTAKGISLVKTPGQMAYGLMLLENCRDLLQDLGHISLFNMLLEKAGLPSDIRCININNDYPDQFPRNPDVVLPQTTAEDLISGLYHSLENIFIDGRSIGDDGQFSRAGPSGAGPSGAGLSRTRPIQRQRRSPNRFSHSKFPLSRGREAAS
jgi:hypothetical protein